jgi:hypothetical protein
MAFGVKREWKKRNGGGKDYPGHPETAHVHKTHDVTQMVTDTRSQRSPTRPSESAKLVPSD